MHVWTRSPPKRVPASVALLSVARQRIYALYPLYLSCILVEYTAQPLSRAVSSLQPPGTSQENRLNVAFTTCGRRTKYISVPRHFSYARATPGRRTAALNAAPTLRPRGSRCSQSPSKSAPRRPCTSLKTPVVPIGPSKHPQVELASGASHSRSADSLRSRSCARPCAMPRLRARCAAARYPENTNSPANA